MAVRLDDLRSMVEVSATRMRGMMAAICNVVFAVRPEVSCVDMIPETSLLHGGTDVWLIGENCIHPSPFGAGKHSDVGPVSSAENAKVGTSVEGSVGLAKGSGWLAHEYAARTVPFHSRRDLAVALMRQPEQLLIQASL